MKTWQVILLVVVGYFLFIKNNLPSLPGFNGNYTDGYPTGNNNGSAPKATFLPPYPTAANMVSSGYCVYNITTNSYVTLNSAFDAGLSGYLSDYAVSPSSQATFAAFLQLMTPMGSGADAIVVPELPLPVVIPSSGSGGNSNTFDDTVNAAIFSYNSFFTNNLPPGVLMLETSPVNTGTGQGNVANNGTGQGNGNPAYLNALLEVGTGIMKLVG